MRAKTRYYRWERWDGAKMLEKTEKVEGGIIRRLYINNQLAMTTYSPRPYKLGQACDGTIGNCVLTLFWHFCKAKKVSPSYLMQKVYPQKRKDWMPSDWDRIVELGDWEGIELPKRWDKKAFAGLVESLTEINYHSLVGLLREKYR